MVMAWTKEDLDALEAAIKSGVQEVDYPGGQRIKYHTLNDMLKLRRAIILEINSTAGGKAYALVDFRR
jgi:hypothetical protein